MEFVQFESPFMNVELRAKLLLIHFLRVGIQYPSIITATISLHPLLLGTSESHSLYCGRSNFIIYWFPVSSILLFGTPKLILVIAAYCSKVRAHPEIIVYQAAHTLSSHNSSSRSNNPRKPFPHADPSAISLQRRSHVNQFVCLY